MSSADRIHRTVTTVPMTADQLRPGMVVTTNTADPEEERSQAIVVACSMTRQGTMLVKFCPVVFLKAFETEFGPGVIIHVVRPVKEEEPEPEPIVASVMDWRTVNVLVKGTQDRAKAIDIALRQAGVNEDDDNVRITAERGYRDSFVVEISITNIVKEVE